MIEPIDNIVIYQPDGLSEVEVRLRDETVWLSQAQMAALFDKDSDTIGLHLKNIYQSGELIESTTTGKSSVVRQEGGRQVKRNIKVYNLDAIISVGYRVNSKKGTQFRIWASHVLKHIHNTTELVGAHCMRPQMRLECKDSNAQPGHVQPGRVQRAPTVGALFMGLNCRLTNGSMRNFLQTP